MKSLEKTFYLSGVFARGRMNVSVDHVVIVDVTIWNWMSHVAVLKVDLFWTVRFQLWIFDILEILILSSVTLKVVRVVRVVA